MPGYACGRIYVELVSRELDRAWRAATLTVARCVVVMLPKYSRQISKGQQAFSRSVSAATFITESTVVDPYACVLATLRRPWAGCAYPSLRASSLIIVFYESIYRMQR